MKPLLDYHRLALLKARSRWQDKADRCHHLLGRFSLNLATTVPVGKERRRLNKWMSVLHRCHRHMDRLAVLLGAIVPRVVDSTEIHSRAFLYHLNAGLTAN